MCIRTCLAHAPQVFRRQNAAVADDSAVILVAYDEMFAKTIENVGVNTGDAAALLSAELLLEALVTQFLRRKDFAWE